MNVRASANYKILCFFFISGYNSFEFMYIYRGVTKRPPHINENIIWYKLKDG